MFSKNKGVVLITTLFVILLLSAISVNFGNKYLIALKRDQYAEFQIKSLNIFRNSEIYSIDIIEKELRYNLNKVSRNNPILLNPFELNFDTSKIKIKIEDASSCFNINSLVLYISVDVLLLDPAVSQFVILIGLSLINFFFIRKIYKL